MGTSFYCNEEKKNNKNNTKSNVNSVDKGKNNRLSKSTNNRIVNRNKFIEHIQQNDFPKKYSENNKESDIIEDGIQKNNENSKIEQSSNSDDLKDSKSKISNINGDISKIKFKESINNNNSFLNFDINKNYYLVCPSCKCHTPHIEKINYSSKENDFKVDYYCPCKNNMLKYSFLKTFISLDKPSDLCPLHCKNILNYFCKNCKKSFCELCKEEHNSHKIEDNDNIISKENLDELIKIIDEKEDEFKGNEFLKNYFKNI